MDERIALREKSIIADKYIIDEEIGRGGSCIVYNGHYIDDKSISHKIRIKEFYPYQADIVRENTNLIFVETNEVLERKEHFISSYERNVLFHNAEIFNNTSVDARDIIEDNGTIYIVLSMDGGCSLDQYCPSSVRECIEISRAIARTIVKYHRQGYLHLDIKPENVLVLNDTKDMVCLFDFDSVEEITKIKTGCVRLSFSEGSSAPELISGSISKIGPETDIFSIGVLLYGLLWCDKPGLKEKKHNAIYDFETMKYSVSRYSKAAFSALEKFLRKTMSISVGLRYSDMSDVINQLDLLYKLFDEERSYLVTNLPRYDEFFIGRDVEISDIYHQLSEHGRVFLYGEGGIGKSSLAINYSRKYENEFDEIVYLKYTGSWIESIKENFSIQITNFEQDHSETDRDYILRKIRFFVENASDKTLLIIDNLDRNDDSSENAIFKSFLHSRAKIIITSRLKNWESQGIIDVPPIKRDEDRQALFLHFSKKNEIDDYDILLMNRYCNNTIAIKLVAKQIVASRTSSKAILERINEKGLSNAGKERVSLLKDGEHTKKSSFDHVKEIFDISDLSQEETTALFDISLFGYVGDSIVHIYKLLELDSYDVINDLIEKSWINIDESDYITMHPLVLEVIQENTKEQIKQCFDFLDKFKYECVKELDWEQIDYFELIKIISRIDSVLANISYIHLADKKIGDYFVTLIPFLNKDGTISSIKIVKYWELAAENLELYKGKLDPIYILCKIDIVSALIDSGQYEKAKEVCQESIELIDKYSEIDSKWVDCNLYGIVYNNLASAYMHTEQKEIAAAYYLKAIDNQQYSGDFYNYSLTACHLAEMYLNIWDEKHDHSKLVDAKDIIDEVISTTEWIDTDEAFNNEYFDSTRINLDLIRSKAYHILGDIYVSEKKLEKAIATYDKVINCLDGYNGYYEELLDRCYRIAHTLILVKEPIYICSSKKYLEKAIKSIEYIGIERKSIEYFRIVSYFGNIAFYEGDFDSAKSFFAKALEVYQKYNMDDAFDYSKTLYNLADSEKMTGEIQNAIIHYREALLYIEDSVDNKEFISTINTKIKRLMVKKNLCVEEQKIENQLTYDDFNIHFNNEDWNFLVRYSEGGWHEFVPGDDFSTERNISFDACLQDITDVYGQGEYYRITDVREEPFYVFLDECSAEDITHLKKATHKICYYYFSETASISFYFNDEKIVMIGFLSDCGE